MLHCRWIHAAVVAGLWLAWFPATAGGPPRQDDDLSVWIDERQVRRFSDDYGCRWDSPVVRAEALIAAGLSTSLRVHNEDEYKQSIPMELYAIVDGHVLPYILDPNLDNYLPIIPADVAYINISWKSGHHHRYYYDFEELQSLSDDVSFNPLVSVALHGRIPIKPHVFSLILPCSGLVRGIATLAVCLVIRDHKGNILPGMPLRIRLQKQCSQNDTGPLCRALFSKGLSCSTAKLPAAGHCDTDFCTKKCLNGGTCWKKDTCRCTSGFYGPQCQYNKCTEECQNGGLCIGHNKCFCHRRYTGKFCQIPKILLCRKRLRHKKCPKEDA